MLMMGKKPEGWPRDTPAPPESHVIVGAAAGIQGGWNYPVRVFRCGDGKLWSLDDRGWYERQESELAYVVCEKHDPAICGLLLIQKGTPLAAYKADPNGTACAWVEAERKRERDGNIVYLECAEPVEKVLSVCVHDAPTLPLPRRAWV